MKTELGMAALLAAALIETSCSGGRLSADTDHAPVPKAVRTATVELAHRNDPAKYSAILTPSAQVDMAFRVSGYVVDLYQTKSADGRGGPLEPGSYIAAGTVLARLRPSDYQAVVDKARGVEEESQAGVRTAEAQLVQAQASLTQAELDFGRISTLFEQESVTKPIYDASNARLEAAKAGVDAARAAIAAARKRQDSAQAQLREAEIALGDTELRAPFAATVLARRVELGTLATAGAPAFTLADLATLKARFSVPDYALREFRQGQSLALLIDAFPGQRFVGRVLAIAAAADPKARSFEIEAVIPNSGSSLRSGMIATVVAGAVESGEAQVQVPVAALVHDPTSNRYIVYTIDESSGRPVAKAIPVEPGPLAGNQVVVLRGLQAGQRIVIMGANLLQPGDAVQEVE
jgi:RND family efflux transporter MFP subunit